MSEPIRYGWACPVGARAFHIFAEGGWRSLCCGWGYKGPLGPMLDPDLILKPSPGDCASCVRVFNALRRERLGGS